MWDEIMLFDIQNNSLLKSQESRFILKNRDNNDVYPRFFVKIKIRKSVCVEHNI